jgi:rusticyanin
MRMQRNRIVATALIGGLTVGAASTGFVIAQLVSYSGHNYAGQYPNAPATPADPPSSKGPMSSMPSPAGVPPGDGGTFSDSSLAQFIAQKAGTGLAGRAPQNVPAGQVKALADQVPAGASIDTRTNTLTFAGATVSFTVVAIAPGKPDMTFVVGGLVNPTIIVPTGARIMVKFINNDTDEAHGWLVTANKPPFEFGQPDSPAIAGAYVGIVGDPTAAGDGANTISFTASGAGSYDYICPMPGHAQMGMNGSFVVR